MKSLIGKNRELDNEEIEQSVRLVAMEWDRFGGRLNEVLNAFLISKILGCDFNFTWPETDREILGNVSDQLHYFSEDFISTHYSDSIDGPVYDLYPSSEKSKEDLLNEMNCSGFENFRLGNRLSRSIPKVKNIDTQSLYQSLGATLWSEEAEKIKETTALIFKTNQVVNTIHIRSGDLLTGAWKQYPDVTKYLPTGVIFTFLRKNSTEKFAIISDTFELSEVISQKFDNTISSVAFHNQASINKFFVDLQDLFIMSLSEKVYAPGSSVFSLLGSRLGGSEISLIYENFENEDWKSAFRLSLESQTYVNFSVDIARKTQARDIAWLVDRLWSQLTFSEFEEATRLAAQADDTFVVSLSQRAIFLLLEGDFLAAEKLMLSAIELAELAIHVHGDPLYYALVASLVICHVQLLCSLDFSDTNVSDIRNQYSKIFDQGVYQIPKWWEVDPNLRLAHEKFEEILLVMQQNPEIYLMCNSDAKNIFKNKILEEFQRNIFDMCDYAHFLTHLTRALTRTAEATLSEISKS